MITAYKWLYYGVLRHFAKSGKMPKTTLITRRSIDFVREVISKAVDYNYNLYIKLHSFQTFLFDLAIIFQHKINNVAVFIQ